MLDPQKPPAPQVPCEEENCEQTVHATCDRCGLALHDFTTYQVIGNAAIEYDTPDSSSYHYDDIDGKFSICCLDVMEALNVMADVKAAFNQMVEVGITGVFPTRAERGLSPEDS